MEKLLGIYKSFWEDGTDFKGTLSRNDFWIALWWNVIVYILIFWYIMAYKQREGAIFGIFVLVVYGLANILPLISSMARRYNDLDLSKYWLLITLLLPIVLLVIGGLACQIIAGVLFLAHIILLMLPKHEFANQHN